MGKSIFPLLAEFNVTLIQQEILPALQQVDKYLKYPFRAQSLEGLKFSDILNDMMCKLMKSIVEQEVK